MGSHCIAGTKTVTPQFFFNHCGGLAWGGKSIPELSQDDLLAMHDFIQLEACRRGYNDARQSQVADWNPFHPDFFFGEPHKAWQYFYDAGLSGTAKDLDADGLERFVVPDWPAPESYEVVIWAGVMAALVELANGCEQSWRDLGCDRQSSMRDVVLALDLWLQAHSWSDDVWHDAPEGVSNYVVSLDDIESTRPNTGQQGVL